MQVARADVYVALRYGGWQEAALKALAVGFDSRSREFPASALKDVLEAVQASGTAGGMPDKALKQTVIPFAKLKMGEAQSGGAQVGCCARLFRLPWGTPWCGSSRSHDMFPANMWCSSVWLQAPMRSAHVAASSMEDHSQPQL